MCPPVILANDAISRMACSAGVVVSCRGTDGFDGADVSRGSDDLLGRSVLFCWYGTADGLLDQCAGHQRPTSHLVVIGLPTGRLVSSLLSAGGRIPYGSSGLKPAGMTYPCVALSARHNGVGDPRSPSLLPCQTRRVPMPPSFILSGTDCLLGSLLSNCLASRQDQEQSC